MEPVRILGVKPVARCWGPHLAPCGRWDLLDCRRDPGGTYSVGLVGPGPLSGGQHGGRGGGSAHLPTESLALAGTWAPCGRHGALGEGPH